MATDIVVLYNLALDAIGARNKISLPTEESREAEACNLWFPNIRDQVLASAPWPEATRMERLALVSTQDDDTWTLGEPRPDILNSYAFPTDCVRPQYLSDYSQFSVQARTLENPAQNTVVSESKVIMTNAPSPVLVYTFRQTKVPTWSHELQMAVMYGLAASICSTLTGKPSRSKILVEQANARIMAARESAANTNDERLDSLPDWIAGRGYTDTSSRVRYFYPFGALLATASVS